MIWDIFSSRILFSFSISVKRPRILGILSQLTFEHGFLLKVPDSDASSHAGRSVVVDSTLDVLETAPVDLLVLGLPLFVKNFTAYRAPSIHNFKLIKLLINSQSGTFIEQAHGSLELDVKHERV
jgi:hypothetical protein